MSLDDKRARKKNKTFVELQELTPWSNYALKEKIPKADEIYFRPNPKLNAKICLWMGDITSLCADAIVNPTNGTLLGGSGLNGEIHSRAGPLLREECKEYPVLPGKRMIRLETGYAIVTCGYWLPAKYVIHTVGPTVNDTVREIHENLLSSCYHECLDAVKSHNERYRRVHDSRQDELKEVEKNKETFQKLGLESTEVDGEIIGVEYSDASQGNVFVKPPIKSIAFPCISTGIYGYPSEKAADVALMTIRKWIDNPHNHNEVEHLDMIIFCVMLENDMRIYNDLIPKYFPIYDGKIRKTSHISSPVRTKARVAHAMERRTNTNPTTETSQKIQQTKITTFSSSPEAPRTERVMPSLADQDNNRTPHNDHQAGKVTSIQEKGGNSHGHTDVIIMKSTSSQQQSTPPQDLKQMHLNQGSYNIQLTPQTHSHPVNEPRSISFKPISPKSTKHNDKKAKNEKKKEDQLAKKEAKMMKKQQEKSAKKENKKAKKMQQLDDFAPMDIEFDDDLLLAPTPVKNVPVLTPVAQKVSHPPVQRVVAPSPVHRLPTPSPSQHERGKQLTEGRNDFGKNGQTPKTLTTTRDSIGSDIDYDDDDNDDEDMPPPPVSFDDDDVFDEASFPPPPPQSLPPPLSDEETDSTPAMIPPMSVVTTIY